MNLYVNICMLNISSISLTLELCLYSHGNYLGRFNVVHLDVGYI